MRLFKAQSIAIQRRSNRIRSLIEVQTKKALKIEPMPIFTKLKTFKNKNISNKNQITQPLNLSKKIIRLEILCKNWDLSSSKNSENRTASHNKASNKRLRDRTYSSITPKMLFLWLSSPCFNKMAVQILLLAKRRWCLPHPKVSEAIVLWGLNSSNKTKRHRQKRCKISSWISLNWAKSSQRKKARS